MYNFKSCSITMIATKLAARHPLKGLCLNFGRMQYDNVACLHAGYAKAAHAATTFSNKPRASGANFSALIQNRWATSATSSVKSDKEASRPDPINDQPWKKTTYTSHWAAERIASIALVGLVPAAAFVHHPVLDYSLALILGAHLHWGFEGIVADYIREEIFPKFVIKLAVVLTQLFGATMIAALIYFCYNDVGIIQATKALWSL